MSHKPLHDVSSPRWVMRALPRAVPSSILVLGALTPAIALAAAPANFCKVDTLDGSASVDLALTDPEYPLPWPVDAKATLAGSGALSRGSTCSNALLLQDCFSEALRRYLGEAPRFAKWADSRGLDPLAVLLAFSAQETALGLNVARAPEAIGSGLGLLGVREWDESVLGQPPAAGAYNALAGLRAGLIALDRAAERLSPGDGLFELARSYAITRPPAEREAYAHGVVTNATKGLASCASARWKPASTTDTAPALPSDLTDGSSRRLLLPVEPMSAMGDRFLMSVPEGIDDMRVRSLDAAGWSEPLTVGEDGLLCVKQGSGKPARLLVTGTQDGKAVHQFLPLALDPDVGTIPACPEGPAQIGPIPGPKSSPIPASDVPLVTNLKNGDAVLNGFEMRFAKGLDDISVSAVYEGGGTLPLVEDAASRDVMCYAESRGAPTRSIRLRVEGRAGERRVRQDVTLSFSPIDWAEGACPRREGASLVRSREAATTKVLVAPLDGQSLSNGVVFQPRDGVTNVRIKAPWGGKSWTIFDGLAFNLAGCFVFTNPGRREIQVQGTKDGQIVSETLTINVQGYRSNDARCPVKPGGVIYSPSLSTVSQDVPLTPVPPDQEPNVQPRDPQSGIIVSMPLPGSTIPNGVPLQFQRDFTDIRVYVENGSNRVELTSFPLEANRQGFCYRFINKGIRRLVVTGKAPDGSLVTHNLSYEITGEQRSINWCTDPSVQGGKVFDPNVAVQDVISVDSQAVEARNRIVQEAMSWIGKGFRPGVSAMCAEFVRAVLAKACNARFASSHSRVIRARTPYDLALLPANAGFTPSFANSLAGDEIGRKVNTMSELIPGDLVYKANTYGNWRNGVITHVGIYVGNGQYVDRPTSGGPVLRRAVNSGTGRFVSGTRVYTSWCTGPDGALAKYID